MAEKVRQILNPRDVNTHEKRKVVVVKHWRNERRSVEALRVHNHSGKHDLCCVHGILDISRIANELFERPPKADL